MSLLEMMVMLEVLEVFFINPPDLGGQLRELLLRQRFQIFD